MVWRAKTELVWFRLLGYQQIVSEEIWANDRKPKKDGESERPFLTYTVTPTRMVPHYDRQRCHLCLSYD